MIPAHSTRIDIQVGEQPSLYEAVEISDPVDDEFLFTDIDLRDMLSQTTGLQPPWNLDDIGWANMLSQQLP
jgi:hypothetical protein